MPHVCHVRGRTLAKVVLLVLKHGEHTCLVIRAHKLCVASRRRMWDIREVVAMLDNLRADTAKGTTLSADIADVSARRSRGALAYQACFTQKAL